MNNKQTSPAGFQEPKRQSKFTREQYLAFTAILETTGTEPAAYFTAKAAKALEYNARRDFLENLSLYYSGLYTVEDKQRRTAAARGIEDLARILYAAEDLEESIKAAGLLFSEYAKACEDERRRAAALESWQKYKSK